MDFNIRAMVKGSYAEIYSGKLSYKKTILWLIPIHSNQTVTVKVLSSIPWETIPGGQFDIDAIFTNFPPSPLTGGNSVWGTYDVSYFHTNRITFVPTVSALDIGNVGTSSPHEVFFNKYIGALPQAAPYETKFDNFTTARPDESEEPRNEDHIEIASRNAFFISKELHELNYLANCENACLDKKIEGPNIICKNGSITYTIPYQPYAGNSISWSASPSGIVTISPSGNTCVVSGNGTIGDVVLKATINTGADQCGMVEFTTNIGVGSELQPYNYTASPESLTFDAVVEPHLAGTTYQWSLDNGVNWQPVTYNYRFNNLFKCPPSNLKKYKVKVFLPGCVGVQQELTSNYLVEGMGMPSGPMSALLDTAVKVYPNPSRDGWNIALPLSSENIQLTLCDITGKEIKNFRVNGQQTHFIENKSLPSGVYILKILLNNETVIKKIAKF